MFLKPAIVVATIACLSVPVFGGVPGSVNLRIMTAETFDGSTGVGNGDSSAGPIMVSPGASSFSQDFYVQALITGDPAATGLTTFDGTITDDTSGTIGKAALTNTEAIGFAVPGPDFQSRTGMFPNYRSTIGTNNEQTGNGDATGSIWNYLPLDISPGNGEAIGGTWANIYKFNWSTSDTSGRTVTLTAGGTFGGYQASSGLQQPAPLLAGTFMVIFVPAPSTGVLIGAGLLAFTRRRR